MAENTDEHIKKLGAYMAKRAAARETQAERMIDNLTEREMRLMREAAVMGFVRGSMAAGGMARENFPKDTAIFHEVLLAAAEFDDLYPFISSLDA